MESIGSDGNATGWSENLDTVVYGWVTRILSGSKTDWYKFVKLNDQSSVPIVQAFMYYFLSHGLGFCNKDTSLALDYAEEALHWIEAEATVGCNPYAQFIFANMHAQGHIVIRDEVRALEFLHLSAMRECELAFAQLGASYSMGSGCTACPVVAMHWLNRAASSEVARSRDSDAYSQHSKAKISILSDLLARALRGQPTATDALKLASSRDLLTSQVPLSPQNAGEHGGGSLKVEYVLYDPLADGLMAVLAHCDAGFHKKSLDETAHRLSSCASTLEAMVSAGGSGAHSVFERSVAAFVLGYVSLFGLTGLVSSAGSQKTRLRHQDSDRREHDCAVAFAYFAQAAEVGHGQGAGLAAAECYLGLCHLYGVGTPVSAHAGLRLLTRAADRGDAMGSYWLGICLLYGVGAEESFSEGSTGSRNLALLWEQVHLSEQMMIESEGDLSTALAFPSYKPSRGDIDVGGAIGLEATMRRDGAKLYNADTSAANLSAGISRVRTAAVLGFAPAQNRLGELYSTGVVLSSVGDVSESTHSPFASYTRSAASTDVSTPRHLWATYIHSARFCTAADTDTVLNRDTHEAYRNFSLAARQHCLRALLNIANCYHHGVGVREDAATASKFHTAAILQYQQTTECA